MKIKLNTIYNNINDKNIIFNSNPKDIHFYKDLIEDSYSDYTLDNTFCIFKSINNIFLLIYSNEKKSIISYDIINDKKINEIKKAHDKYITNFRYYLDEINNRDLFISISADDNNIKLWNINNFECILNIKEIYKTGNLYSACFLNYKNQIYITTSNCGWSAEKIKIFDLKGNITKEINNSNHSTYFIDIYNDNIFSNYYIITGNQGYVISYDFEKNKIFNKYCDNLDECHDSVLINDYQIEVIKLIASSKSGNIRIWDFNNGILLSEIRVSNYYLESFSLWNNQYLFVGCGDKTIKLIDIDIGKTIKKLNGHSNSVISIKKIIHPYFGECLVSQGYEKNQIKLWINNNLI